VRSIPGLDSLRSAPRDKQVDAIVSVLLGGSVSPDTRAVLISGENPLMANAKDSTSMSDMPNARQLSGIAQVVGLALGSPEFQRR
jgi:hypothetical protein